MNSEFVLTDQPSNIALIKYMGKENIEANVPANASLSYTLPHLKSFVRISISDTDSDVWQPLLIPDQSLIAVNLSDKSKQRFLKHLDFLKQSFGVTAQFKIESANNFPADCGIASSASSFAALTKAAIEMFQKMGVKQAFCSTGDMAALSAKGSGSSCRSFFGPWVLWSGNSVRPLELPYENLYHQVVVVDSAKKSVSSSEAHKRDVSSANYQGRPMRAQDRLAHLLEAFRHQDWKLAFEISWDEFTDMHNLFETSEPGFSYLTKTSHEALQFAKGIWADHQSGPIATTDAGPNVHLLWRPEDKVLAKSFEQDLSKFGKVISSE